MNWGEALNNNHHIISPQLNDALCPVNLLKQHVSLLNHKCDALFQYDLIDKKSYFNKPIGKNILAAMMKNISKDTQLTQIYTNH